MAAGKRRAGGEQIQSFAVEFPGQRNREFSNVLQGKIFQQQGFVSNIFPPPMHDPAPNFTYFWKSDDVKRIKVFVQRVVVR